jgi:hypothetical protein
MRVSALRRAIAAGGLARDDGWAEHAFGLVVGGIQAVAVQEAKEVGALFAQALSQALVVGVGQLAPRVDQVIQPAFQPSGPNAELAGGQAGLLTTQGKCGSQNPSVPQLDDANLADVI